MGPTPGGARPTLRPVCQENRHRDEHGAEGTFVHFMCECEVTDLPKVFQPKERKARARRAAANAGARTG